MRRLKRLKRSIAAIEILRREKKKKTYKELSKELNLPITVLNRYVLGRVVPNDQKSKKIIEKYRTNLKQEAKSKILRFGEFINDMELISDAELLSAIADSVAADYEKIELVVTTEDGLPFSALLAKKIGAKIGFLRSRKKRGVKDYIEINLFDEKGNSLPLFLPKEICSKKTKTLFVDDVIRTGKTSETIVKKLSKHSSLVGCFALISIGKKGKTNVEKEIPFKTFVELNEDG